MHYGKLIFEEEENCGYYFVGDDARDTYDHMTATHIATRINKELEAAGTHRRVLVRRVGVVKTEVLKKEGPWDPGTVTRVTVQEQLDDMSSRIKRLLAKVKVPI